MFNRYSVVWKFVHFLGATSPPPVDTKARPEEEEAEIKVSRFKRSKDGMLYIKPYEVKAHLREIAGYLSREEDSKGLKARVAQTLYVVPSGVVPSGTDVKTSNPIIRLYRDGRYLTGADGVEEIKGRRLEFLTIPEITFDILILKNSPVNGKLESLFELGSVKGFGGARCSREWGRYEFEINIARGKGQSSPRRRIVQKSPAPGSE